MKTALVFSLAVLFLCIAAPPFTQAADPDNGQGLTRIAAAGPDVPPTPPGNVRAPAPGRQYGPGGFQGYGAYGRWGGMAAFLNLSADQRAKMRNLWARYYLDTRDLRYDLMQRRLEMRRLFTDPKANSAALLARHKEISALQQRLMDRRAQTMIEWRALLTPEQIQKLDLVGMAHSRMGYGMERGMMGHGMGYGMGQGMMGGPAW